MPKAMVRKLQSLWAVVAYRTLAPCFTMQVPNIFLHSSLKVVHHGHLVLHITSQKCRSCTLSLLGRTITRAGTFAEDTASSDSGRRVIVVEANRLEKVHWNFEVEHKIPASDDRARNQGNEDDQNNEVENGIADDPTLTKLRLLERVDRRPDLTAAVMLAEDLAAQKGVTYLGRSQNSMTEWNLST
jgi:hypothetical protein